MKTLRDVASRIDAELKGDGAYAIHGVADIERLAPEDALRDHYLYYIETPAVLKRHPRAAESGGILTVPALAGEFPRALIARSSGRLALIALLKAFDRAPSFAAGAVPQAVVDPSAEVAASAAVLPGAVVMAGASIGERCVLYPGVVVEPFASVGEGTVLYPNVVVGHHCVIGRRCIVHGGTVIGADGFGFHDDASGRHKIPQIGIVTLGDDVEIGASCTIDRAAIEVTSIGAQTKIDDQVHIAHNCRVGPYNYIAGNSGLAGSVVTEAGVMISGTCSIKDHVTLAKGTIVMGMSAIAQDTEPKTAYFGIPAKPARQTHKMHAALERLPELLAKVRALEEKIERLEGKPNPSAG